MMQTFAFFGLDMISQWILAGCLGSAIIILADGYVKRMGTGSDKRRVERLEARVRDLEGRLQASDERLETVRTLVLATDFEARRRLADKLAAEESASSEPSSARVLTQRGE